MGTESKDNLLSSRLNELLILLMYSNTGTFASLETTATQRNLALSKLKRGLNQLCISFVEINLPTHAEIVRSLLDGSEMRRVDLVNLPDNIIVPGNFEVLREELANTGRSQVFIVSPKEKNRLAEKAPNLWSRVANY